jgi:hypothetical protein
MRSRRLVPYLAVGAVLVGAPLAGSSPGRISACSLPPPSSTGGTVSATYCDATGQYLPTVDYLQFRISGANLKLRAGTPNQYDGTAAGKVITLSGQMSVTIAKGYVSDVGMSARLATKTLKLFGGRVTGQTVTKPFSLTFTIGKDATEPASGGTYVSGEARLDVCGGSCAGYSIGFIITLPKTAPGTTTPTTRAPSLQAAAYAQLKAWMAQFDKDGFARVTDIGTLTLYRATLAGLTIKVDPKQKAVALYDPNTRSITFSRDPRTLKPDDAAFGETVWHELTHAIEDRHGDIGVLDNKLYAERNIEFMTHVTRSALPILERMEKQAKAGAPVAKLRQLWKAYQKAMTEAYRLPETRKYPPDLELLRTWFGFNANPEAVRRLYLSGKALPGAAGANLKKALGR